MVQTLYILGLVWLCIPAISATTIEDLRNSSVDLNCSESVTGTLTSEMSSVLYRLEIEEDAHVFMYTCFSDIDTVIDSISLDSGAIETERYDDDGSHMCSGLTHSGGLKEFLSFEDTIADEYFFELSGYAGALGSYTLEVICAPSSTYTVLECGDVFYGNLDSPNFDFVMPLSYTSVQIENCQSAATENVTIVMTPLIGSEEEVTFIFDPNECDEEGFDINDISPDLYIVSVSNSSSLNASYDFTINCDGYYDHPTTTDLPIDTDELRNRSMDISCGDSVEGNIAIPYSSDVYRLQTEEEQDIYFYTCFSSMDTVLETITLDSAGTVENEYFDDYGSSNCRSLNPGSSLNEFVLMGNADANEYFIDVSGFSSRTGTYVFGVLCLPPRNNTALECGDAFSGTLDSSNSYEEADYTMFAENEEVQFEHCSGSSDSELTVVMTPLISSDEEITFVIDPNQCDELGYDINEVPADLYSVSVSNPNNIDSSYDFTINCNAIAQQISTTEVDSSETTTTTTTTTESDSEDTGIVLVTEDEADGTLRLSFTLTTSSVAAEDESTTVSDSDIISDGWESMMTTLGIEGVDSVTMTEGSYTIVTSSRRRLLQDSTTYEITAVLSTSFEDTSNLEDAATYFADLLAGDITDETVTSVEDLEFSFAQEVAAVATNDYDFSYGDVEVSGLTVEVYEDGEAVSVTAWVEESDDTNDAPQRVQFSWVVQVFFSIFGLLMAFCA